MVEDSKMVRLMRNAIINCVEQDDAIRKFGSDDATVNFFLTRYKKKNPDLDIDKSELMTMTGSFLGAGAILNLKKILIDIENLICQGKVDEGRELLTGFIESEELEAIENFKWLILDDD